MARATGSPRGPAKPNRAMPVPHHDRGSRCWRSGLTGACVYCGQTLALFPSQAAMRAEGLNGDEMRAAIAAWVPRGPCPIQGEGPRKLARLVSTGGKPSG